MNLTVQVQGVVYSFVCGMWFSFVYSVINRLFYRYKKAISRLILQVCIGVSFGLTYYYGLLVINNGILRIYFIIGFMMGYIVYENYYAFPLLIIIERWMRQLKKVLKPIYFFFSKIRVILKKIKKRVIRWWPKRKKQKEKQETEPS